MISRILRPFAAMLGIALVAISQPASADTWPLPETTTYLSDDGAFRLTIEPSPIDSALEYFSEEIDAADRGVEIERPSPLAVFERRTTGDEYRPLWTTRLVNSVTPVQAIISADGAIIATLDNWYSTGYGENVVVFYDGEGSLIRTLQLEDFLPEHLVRAFPSSASSLQWRGRARFDERGRLVIALRVPSPESGSDETVEIALEPTAGSAILLDELGWQTMLAAAHEVNAAREAAEIERLRYLTDPLPTPFPGDTRAWHGYLREAHLRLAPDIMTWPSVAVKLVDPPGHERHDRSVGWLMDEFAEHRGYSSGDVAIAAPGAPDTLISALERALDGFTPDSLAETTVYLSIEASHRRLAQDMLQRAGAQVVWLDPETTIPQRAERIPGSAEEAVFQMESRSRQTEEMREMMLDLEDLEPIAD